MITIENLHEQKLSDFMESLISDIEYSRSCGFKINMEHWIVSEGPKGGKICSVCLGGAALCGFLDNLCDLKVKHHLVRGEVSSRISKGSFNKERLLSNMALSLDYFRRGVFNTFFNYITKVLVKIEDISWETTDAIILEYRKKLSLKGFQSEFNGLLEEKEVEQLLKNILIFVKLLKKYKL